MFWDWGWLQRNVVTTVTPADGGGSTGALAPAYAKGLTPEHAQRAIAVLNDRGASSPDLTRPR